MGVGLLIADNKNADFDQAGTGAVMIAIGFLADLGSIPLFIASSKNKKRAMKATVSLNTGRSCGAKTKYTEYQVSGHFIPHPVVITPL